MSVVWNLENKGDSLTLTQETSEISKILPSIFIGIFFWVFLGILREEATAELSRLDFSEIIIALVVFVGAALVSLVVVVRSRGIFQIILDKSSDKIFVGHHFNGKHLCKKWLGGGIYNLSDFKHASNEIDSMQGRGRRKILLYPNEEKERKLTLFAASTLIAQEFCKDINRFIKS